MEDLNDNSLVKVDLTDEQKKRIRERTGRDVASLEFSVEQLEERIAPRQIGRFL